MNESVSPRADYGTDAPPVVRNLTLAGAGSIIAGIVLNLLLASASPLIAGILLAWGVAAGASLLVTAGLMVWSRRTGKLRERERLVDSLALRSRSASR